MPSAAITSDHLGRAKRLVDCGLDVEQVAQMLADADAAEAELAWLRESRVDRQTLETRLANYFDLGDFEEFDEHTVADIVQNVFGLGAPAETKGA